MPARATEFFSGLSPQREFERLIDRSAYTPVPPDWWLLVADVVDSTSAIRAGRYRDVNFIGAACIVAAFNRCGKVTLPFSFGGDGALLLAPPDLLESCTEALLGVADSARQAYGLELRVGRVGVGELSERGKDLLIARYQLARGCAIAMFAGGGVRCAEKLIKTDPAYLVPKPSTFPPPNLTGLSCRWEPLRSRRGAMLSLIVQPAEEPGDIICRDVYARLARMLGLPDKPSPVAHGNLRYKFPSSGLSTELLAHKAARDWFSRIRSVTQAALVRVAFALRVPLGPFRPVEYVEETLVRADFLKFDGTLRMVLDVTEEEIGGILGLLENERAACRIHFGVHKSAEAIMTCWVPSLSDGAHIHFVDGADGGYARAAIQLKAQQATDQIQPTGD